MKKYKINIGLLGLIVVNLLLITYAIMWLINLMFLYNLIK